jgi:hypothetical protein
MRVSSTITQEGDQVYRAWDTSGGTTGLLVGGLSNGRVIEFRAEQVNPCGGEFTGRATIEDAGARLRGIYSGNDCMGTLSASFEANKQQGVSR